MAATAAKEKDKDETKDEKKVKEKDDGVINAVYKVNLHCKQCARDIKKPLMATQGVHNVEANMEKGEIKVKGVFDPTKIQKRLEKLSKKKVELISPKPQIKESTVTEKKVVKETKEPISRTIVVKVHMHCDKCEQDLKKKLIKNKVEGTIEPEKLISYLRKKVHKHAELVPSKPQKKEETKEKEKSSPKPPEEEEKKEKKEDKQEKKEDKQEKQEKKEDKQEKKEETTEKEKSSPKPPEKEDKQEKKEDKKDGTEKSTESVSKVIEVKEHVSVVEVKTKEGNTPYFIHYVYAPQTFSDENPNACFIM
ncbi:heavy metal-associated isoprenylated plant protein 4 isoform X2 [Pyrus x bretschneideri]|uniref:heavy metal-associated isoprenylated plant protein 4 isoform X2 n=1 Tax=Pyrus x bretschneideri TaxID=225117 RepID=UPI002030FB41|nr:heavy metal-associated isoprenylated plant protein 4 isoform X2 [Pyrus x bretschneideri]